MERAKDGDSRAINELFGRFLPPLRSWASRRLPRWARDLVDTDDLVQDTIMRVFKRLGAFEVRHTGALQAYLRQAVMNRIRDEIRRKGRRGAAEELDENLADDGASPLECAIGREAVDRYEAALSRLPADDQALIVARVEMGSSYEAIARDFGKRTADAARMAVTRALLRLAEQMTPPPQP